jgi:hypothetical protein
MPVLDNLQHETFSQEIAKGTGVGEAYAIAGYDCTNKAAAAASASRLLKTAKIQARVSELLNGAATRAVISIQKVLEKLDRAYDLAERMEQPSAMVAASMGLAKVAGLIVDKKEVGKPGDFTDVDDQSLDQFIMTEAKALGIVGQKATKH